jgi:hypothetical protein|tara:strand:- start:475 stop:1047 length:573 start_codon:yes stop_codon:yes gene_type:complete
MKDNILKKEFGKKDVQRLRNVLGGKSSERSTDGIGYTKAKEFYEEGDVWTEHGREWTIKDGLRQNITKMGKAKELAMPMFCPTCKKIMKGKNDKSFWSSYRRCFNCQVDFEHELKMGGLWEEWQNQIRKDGIDSFINNYKDWAQEMLDTSNQGFVSEAGDVENWKGGINTELAQKSINDTIEYLTSLKEQ